MDTMIVTGGAGFIGANFVRVALSETDLAVVVLDKLTYAGHRESLAGLEDEPRFRFVQGDIADRGAVDALFRECRPRWVVNFAAESHVDRSIDGPRDFVETNVIGTFTLLEAARALLANASREDAARFRFLQVSTDEVYGSLGESGFFTEDTAYAPNSPYSATKAGADHLVHAYFKTFALPTLLTNCSNNYGPFQYPEKLIPLTMLNALEAKPLPIYGDGAQIRDWLYVEDHCRGILQVLAEATPGARYNLGGNNELKNVDLVDRLCAELERQRPAARNPAMRKAGVAHYGDLKTFVTDRPGHDRRYAIDASKIRGELGWEPRTSVDAGLASTVRWYLDHADWCAAVQSDGNARARIGLAR